MSRTLPPPSADDADRLAKLPTQEVLLFLLRLLGDLARRLDEVQQTVKGNTKEFLTVEETADLAGRSAYTVRRWITEQRLTAKRVAYTGQRGRLLIPRSEVIRLIAGG